VYFFLFLPGSKNNEFLFKINVKKKYCICLENAIFLCAIEGNVCFLKLFWELREFVKTIEMTNLILFSKTGVAATPWSLATTRRSNWRPKCHILPNLSQTIFGRRRFDGTHEALTQRAERQS
jgi:hypothetical protein